jgi:hypothetical protein
MSMISMRQAHRGRIGLNSGDWWLLRWMHPKHLMLIRTHGEKHALDNGHIYTSYSNAVVPRYALEEQKNSCVLVGFRTSCCETIFHVFTHNSTDLSGHEFTVLAVYMKQHAPIHTMVSVISLAKASVVLMRVRGTSCACVCVCVIYLVCTSYNTHTHASINTHTHSSTSTHDNVYA